MLKFKVFVEEKLLLEAELANAATEVVEPVKPNPAKPVSPTPSNVPADLSTSIKKLVDRYKSSNPSGSTYGNIKPLNNIDKVFSRFTTGRVIDMRLRSIDEGDQNKYHVEAIDQNKRKNRKTPVHTTVYYFILKSTNIKGVNDKIAEDNRALGIVDTNENNLKTNKKYYLKIINPDPRNENAAIFYFFDNENEWKINNSKKAFHAKSYILEGAG